MSEQPQIQIVNQQFCRIHGDQWVLQSFTSGLSGGMSSRECPECVKERTAKVLSDRQHSLSRSLPESAGE